MTNYKEWLNTKTYEYKQAVCMFGHSEWIAIPEGAECLTNCKDHNGDEWLLFWKGDYKFCVGHDKEWFYFESGVSEYLNDWCGLAKVIWQRDQDEPFLTPECTLNDQYAEIEQVRQATRDSVNHPNHYADSSIECIDAMEAMMTPEQFIGYLRGNLFKYQWRYEKKNGIEDLKKAQWYLEKLTAKVAEKNAPF